MIFKIFTTAALLAICTAEIKTHTQESSKQAISTQSFTREDVPLSYKFTAIHTMPKSKPHKENTHENHKPYAPIQYAPLHPEQEHLPERQTHVTLPKTNDDGTWNGNAEENNHFTHQINKQHLEPKDITLNNLRDWKHSNFVPGHNVELLQSVNSNPAHNTVYRSSGNDEGKSLNKVNYLRQYILHQDHTTEASIITQAPKNIHETTNIPTINTALYTLLGRQYYRPDVYLQNEHIPEGNVLLPHLKNHKLHLNVARNYGIAQNIPQANTNSMYPTHTQAFVQRMPLNNQLRNFNQKTQLFPLHSLNQHYLIRTA